MLAQAPGVTSATSNPFTVTAGQAAIIQATGGTPQSTVINTAFTVPLQATVTDAAGQPGERRHSHLHGSESGATASLSAPSATTDGSGHASVNATANSVAGSYTVTAGAARCKRRRFVRTDQCRGGGGQPDVRAAAAGHYGWGDDQRGHRKGSPTAGITR